jgi:hypothetical protein
VGDYRRGLNAARWVGANKKLIDKLETLGVTRYNEGRSMEEITLSPYRSPDEWGKSGGVWYLICICAVLAALLFSVLAAVVCFKTYKRTVLMPILAAALVPLGVYVRSVFHAWKNVPLYFALMLARGLVVAVFALFAAWAIGGFEKMPFKKWIVSYGIGTAVALVIYNVLVFIVNNVIWGGTESAVSICVAYYWYAFLIIADSVTVMICYWRTNRKNRKNGGNRHEG